MKSQDILLLLKLLSLEQRDRQDRRKQSEAFAHQRAATAAGGMGIPHVHLSQSDAILESEPFPLLQEQSAYAGWEPNGELSIPEPLSTDSYSLRSLAASLGLSKSEVSNALKRCKEIGLLQPSLSGHEGYSVNRRALVDLIIHAVRFVFPVKPGEIVRGIPTAFAAPILEGKVMSAGDFIPVWPDAHGTRKGQAIIPLFKTVPGAVKKDQLLYHYLALVDALRIGSPREAQVAAQMLKRWTE